ncbi:MAG: hypothetical protein COB17_00615 [Sulfurimonas sp.]|nr:MAG: hypothetical protein COB17_00615 [Sulfurimonas sp.]
MKNYLKILLFLGFILLLNSCGGTNGDYSSETEMKKADLNKKAITFPALPSITPDLNSEEFDKISN